nr:MAG TPA: hypothetical protein [Caudoviricetes sp.]
MRGRDWQSEAMARLSSIGRATPLRIFSNHGNAVAMQITAALRKAIARH